MDTELQVHWDGGMAFSTKIDGYTVQIDGPEEIGGNGTAPRPKPLMLMALAGCTGIDVVYILKKMKVELADFDIQIHSSMSDTDPKVYTAMHIIYTFTGNNLDPKKLERAITLSQEKYCGVSAMYKKAMEITYEMKILAA
jgi:putative redox protein